jgi:hypothetical protein
LIGPPSRPPVESSTPAARGRAIATACAAAAPVLAVLADTATRSPSELREVVSGVALAGDRSLSAPVAQLLVPLCELIPIADREHRALLALSLPAALATYLIARRAQASAHREAGLGADAIAAAIALLAAVLLVSAPPGAAIVVVAIELALTALTAVAAPAVASRLGLACLASLYAAWAAPRLLPALIVPVALAVRSARPAARVPAALSSLPLVLAGVALLLVRDDDAWLVLGRALRTGAFAALAGPLVGSPLVYRAAIAVGAATIAAVALSRLGRDLAIRDRAALAAAAIVALSVEPLRPGGGVEVALVLALPSVSELFVAIYVAVARAIPPARAVLRFGLPWLVPALAGGFAARGAEEEATARRRPIEVAAAVELAPIATLGAFAARPLVVVEDEETLLRDAWGIALDDLRPDLAILPTQSLLLGGEGRMVTRATSRVPRAGELLRSMLAVGEVTESGSSPCAADATLVVDLPSARLREVARHLDPSLGAIRLPLERVDPSDRRLRRQQLLARQRFLDGARARLPDDPWTIAAQRASMRVARLLSLAGDREATLAELARARVLGVDAVRVARWEAKLQAKRGLVDEPELAGE